MKTMKFLRKETKKERYGSKQKALIDLQNKYGKVVVYMPYGEQGSGFYAVEK